MGLGDCGAISGIGRGAFSGEISGIGRGALSGAISGFGDNGEISGIGRGAFSGEISGIGRGAWSGAISGCTSGLTSGRIEGLPFARAAMTAAGFMESSPRT